MSYPLRLEESNSAGPSMQVEVSSCRAQREGNRAVVERSVQRLDWAGMKQRLREIQQAVRNKCTPCLLSGHNADHFPRECTGLSMGWSEIDSSFRTWRSGFTFPTKHCYHCGLPQVSFIR
jgi:hypothetical protein